MRRAVGSAMGAGGREWGRSRARRADRGHAGRCCCDDAVNIVGAVIARKLCAECTAEASVAACAEDWGVDAEIKGNGEVDDA